MKTQAPNDANHQRSLMDIAHRLQVETRAAENIVKWRDKTLASHGLKGPELTLPLLRTAQAQRDAGVMDADMGFFVIVSQVEGIAGDMADDVTVRDPVIQNLHAKLAAIKKREGLEADDYYMLNDPDQPEDHRLLEDQWAHRYDEIYDGIFIDTLKQFGDDDIADLYLRDRATFDSRREVGRCLVHGTRDATGLPCLVK